MGIQESQSHILKQLFIKSFILSAVTFGGGYVIVSLMKETFVDKYGWIDEDEMLDLIAIAQSSPGAIAVNGTIVVGYKLAGIKGVVTAVTATILPPFIIISLIAYVYQLVRQNPWITAILDGMQAGVGAVIISVVFSMVKASKHTSKWKWLGMLLAFCANVFWHVNVVVIIAVAILIGIGQYYVMRKGGRKS